MVASNVKKKKKVISYCTPNISQRKCGTQVRSMVSSSLKSKIILETDQCKRKKELKSSDNAVKHFWEKRSCSLNTIIHLQK